jgi:hypothetical protein
MKDDFEKEIKERIEKLKIRIEELQRRYSELIYLEMLYSKIKKEK